MMENNKNKILKWILIILFVLFGIYYNSQIIITPKMEKIELIIEHDDNGQTIVNKLDNKFHLNTTLLKILLRLSGNDTKIKPGTYDLSNLDNMHDLINIISSKSLIINHNGKIVKDDNIKFTIIEGFNINDIATKLSQESQLEINKDDFISICYDTLFIKSFGIKSNSLEGYLFPDTYYFLKEYSEEDIINIIIKNFNKVFKENIDPIIQSADLTKEDLVILASIIQSESGDEEEMNKISSVFHNRLKKNIPLSADPTILYYMTSEDLSDFKMNNDNSVVFNKYKSRKSGYNTYINKGLPIGPICNPGLSALLSAIKPDKTDFYYFIADDKGKTYFSKTKREHNNKINEFKRTK